MKSIALTDRETSQRLQRCEGVIAKGLRTFIDVGTALAEVKRDKLYRLDYPSFTAYVDAKWPDLGLNYANKMIAAAQVVSDLSQVSTTVLTLPKTETQARPLATLKQPEQRVEAWQQVVARAGDQEITAELVSEVVKEMRAAPSPAADDDWTLDTVAQQVYGTDDAHWCAICETDHPHAGCPDTPAAPSPAARRAVYPVEAWHALSAVDQAYVLSEAPRLRNTRFNRTNEHVEWASWTWNPVTGCDHGCSYCYARVIAERHYGDVGFAPALRPTRLHASRTMGLPPPSAAAQIGDRNVFVCSMADLFGKWVPQAWIDAVFDEVVAAPSWNFLFLTKFPQRLAEQQWPENAWVGTTVDTQARVATAERAFRGVQAGIKWLSCEPLLERLTFSSLTMFDWVVIGAQSAQVGQCAEFQPPWEWVEHLMAQARAAGCQVYMKPNLHSRPREYPHASLSVAPAQMPLVATRAGRGAR